MPQAQFGPIQGGPGETVSEIVLMIANKGGIAGVFVDADGTPLANVPIVITAPALDGEGFQTVHVQTDRADGHITLLNALLPALYSEVTFSTIIDGTQFQAQLEDIEVIEDAIVDLGVISLQAVPEDSGGPASDEE